MATNNNAISLSFDSESINSAHVFKNEALNNATAKIVNLCRNYETTAKQASRELANILWDIEVHKSYLDDGFKSLADYGTTIGLKKGQVHLLARAGKVYADEALPDTIKDLSPSMVNELSSVLDSDSRSKVLEDVTDGKLDGMTQAQLREYSDGIKEETTTGKVVKLYRCDVVSMSVKYSLVLTDSGDSMSPLLVPHDDLESYNGDVYRPRTLYKEAMPETFPAGKVTIDGKEVKRFCVVLNDDPYLVTFIEKPKEAKKKPAKTVQIEQPKTKEELMAQIAALQASLASMDE